MSKPGFEISVELPPDRVADLLCVGIEHGCYYWARIDGYVDPPEGVPTEADLAQQFGPRWSDMLYRHVHYPLLGGGVVFEVEASGRDAPSGRLTLTRAEVQQGLRLLAQRPQAFADLLTEQEDADTGDLFLQLCLLGRHVFA